jgi:hypothetical protein
MRHNIPCHTSIPITDDHRSPDYIEPQPTHETLEFEVTITFEDVLAEIEDPDLEEIKEEGFEIDDIYLALSRKLIADYGSEAIMKFEYDQFGPRFRFINGECIEREIPTPMEVAESLLDSYAFEKIIEAMGTLASYRMEEEITIVFETETEIDHDEY